ncbi:glycosyltransferase family 4 protein [Massilia sp. Leaf139]|uniref:glycosyltransferase family 4 protein n=1 Tax=Massilia sp. Leaf139 TaxID=1736272 RepID=UPI0006F8059F|nr:glycosyltransferase family 4 protein [Massilia sp. Leaf139]KQQ87772.1 hypothetical protein ASF77_13590 [Massilia sp. Leaf139]
MSTAPATLLAVLTSEPGAGGLATAGGCPIAVLPPAAPETEVPAPAASGTRPLRRLAGLVMPAARLVLRRPRVRQLALRVLKRFPGLYARAYRAMMASGTAAPKGNGPAQGDAVATLSPRANAIVRALRSLQRTLKNTAPREAVQRPRLAFVSPLPPERTGIATYSIELLAELAEHLDIELVVAQAEVALPAHLRHLPVRQADWFMEHGDQYDQVLYQFGNSPFHSHMFALLARHPGVVVLHDFFLGGALVHAQMSGAAPGAWAEALLHAHGYGAVRATETPEGRGQAHKDWPASLPVLEHATRTIVHSLHARRLAGDWFGPGAARAIDVIPHPRTPPTRIDRAGARAALGIPEDCFLVCSFGFVAPNKLTHELLRAWIGSALHRDRHCALVLVGANHDSPYGVEVEALIRGAGPQADIRIAGWTDSEVYRQYLQAADVGVQLRTNAHGESSGAVLDCLNYGLATIVNANGSMAEFPPDALCLLPDDFEVAELGTALEALRGDPARRAALGASAIALLDARFRPAQCARQYLATLAAARAETQTRHAAWRAALLQAAPAGEDALIALAARLAAEEGATRRQLLVEVGDWIAPDAVIDPLAAAQLRELLAGSQPGWRVEPVWLDTSGGTPRYRQARAVAARLLGLNGVAQDEQVVDVHAGDVVYAFDAASPSLAAACGTGLLTEWQARGVRLALLVRSPDEALAAPALRLANRLLCPSAAIAQQLAADSGARGPQGRPG